MTHEAIEMLLVEDSPEDVILTKRAIKRMRLTNRLHVAKDGEEASNFLFRRGPFAGAPRPDLVLLDLNLPKKSGHEVLEELRASPEFKDLPVVILTTSEAEEDVLKAVQAGVTNYVTKPIGFDSFLSVVRSMDQLSFSIVRPANVPQSS